MLRRRLFLKAAAASTLAATIPAARAPGARAEDNEALRFPTGFTWGTSSASYQIEGRGDRTADSIWDTFCRLPGVIHDGSNGEIACDHYHRYREDVALLKRVAAGAYRFSVSWPRVLPEGTGQPDARGLDFYSRLVDALLQVGIEPWLCLFHWDLPQALQDRGGWRNRDIAGWYADYAELMSRRLGDRVTRWVMFNEAAVHAIMGHGLGEHAPGFKSRAAMAQAAHHQNLAQGRGLAALRAAGGGRYQLGTVFSLQPVRAASDSEPDREAAAIWDAAWNRAYLDPLLRRAYPARFAPLVDRLVQPGDLEQIAQPVDFIGVNYYGPMYQRADPGGLLGTNWGANPPAMPLTAMGWPVDPAGLTDVLFDLRDHYGNPRVYITENGVFYSENASGGGRIDDQARIAYLRDHIARCHDAIAAGVNLHGYFVWTIMDNFEWAHGYTALFGLAHVDRTTLTRTPKASFDWYARVAATNVL